MRQARVLTLLATDVFLAGLIFGDDVTRVVMAGCCAAVVGPIYRMIRRAAQREGIAEICPDEASRQAVHILAERIRRNRATRASQVDHERPAQFPRE